MMDLSLLTPLLNLAQNELVREKLDESAARLIGTYGDITINPFNIYTIIPVLAAIFLVHFLGVDILGSLKGEGGGGGGGYGAPDAGYGAPDAGYGAPDVGYGAPGSGYGYQSRALDSTFYDNAADQNSGRYGDNAWTGAHSDNDIGYTS